MKISFTRGAVKSYYSIKDYLVREWGERVSEAFEQKTIDFLDLLETFPEIGTVELSEKQIRGFQLTRQIRIFYRIKGEAIIILALFDVKQKASLKLREKWDNKRSNLFGNI